MLISCHFAFYLPLYTFACSASLCLLAVLRARHIFLLDRQSLLPLRPERVHGFMILTHVRRIDNFTGQSLHVQQSGCASDDIIRPYSCLPYSWGEPSLPHKLTVALPGGKHLGTFSLDSVGKVSTLSLGPAPGSKQV